MWHRRTDDDIKKVLQDTEGTDDGKSTEAIVREIIFENIAKSRFGRPCAAPYTLAIDAAPSH